MARHHTARVSLFVAGVALWLLPMAAVASPPAAEAPPVEPAPAPAVAPAPAPTPAPAPAPEPAVAPAPAQPAWAPPLEPSEPSPAVTPAPPPPVLSQQAPCPQEADAAKRALALQRSEKRRARAMLGAGWSLLASMYLSSAMVGTLAIDTAGGDERRRAYGQRMLVPVAGPFMAAFATRSATGALLTAMVGAAQLTGLGLATAGHVRLHRLRREMRLSASVAGPTVGLRMQF